MRCPYCAKEMEAGSLQSPDEIIWFPGTNRYIFRHAALRDGAVPLSPLTIRGYSAVTAYLCRDCQKVVIDYADGKSDLSQR